MDTAPDPNRVELPRGQWATLRPRLKVRGRDLVQRYGMEIASVMPRMMMLQAVMPSDEQQKAGLTPDDTAAVADAMTDAALTADDMEKMQRFQHASIVAWVAQWSFPFPCDMDTLDDLDADEYDALQAACGPRSMSMMVESSGFGPDGVKDPASPTLPSDATSSDGGVSLSTSAPATGPLSSTPASTISGG